MNALHSQLFHEPKKLAVIGSGCSVATEPAAEVSTTTTSHRLEVASSYAPIYDHENISFTLVAKILKWVLIVKSFICISCLSNL